VHRLALVHHQRGHSSFSRELYLCFSALQKLFPKLLIMKYQKNYPFWAWQVVVRWECSEDVEEEQEGHLSKGTSPAGFVAKEFMAGECWFGAGCCGRYARLPESLTRR